MKNLVAGLLFSALATAAHAQSNKLDVDNLKAESVGPGISAITGTATNASGHELVVATVEFNLHDRSGAVVGNAVAQACHLGSGDRWNFRAQAAVPFAEANISAITGTPWGHS